MVLRKSPLQCERPASGGCGLQQGLFGTRERTSAIPLAFRVAPKVRKADPMRWQAEVTGVISSVFPKVGELGGIVDGGRFPTIDTRLRHTPTQPQENRNRLTLAVIADVRFSADVLTFACVRLKRSPAPPHPARFMELLASSGTPLLLVNLIFAAIALAVGFAAGAWVCGGRQATDGTSKTGANDLVGDGEEQRIIIERTMLASDRLRDLATSVASDVGSHSASIGEIEARLEKGRADGVPDADFVLRALDEIEKANAGLQSKLAKAEQQIQTQAEQIKTHESEARTDSLTHLANRRAFDDEVVRRFSEWERKGTVFSMLILDVDHFKKFNDTHGHQAGDEVLRKVGAALTKCAREMDLPCRYGGEEFAIVMPATEPADGTVLAERVRSTIEAMEVPFEGKKLSVTASFGLAGTVPGDDAGMLIKRADEALYASKDAGRNNAHRHTGTESIPITPGRVNSPTAEEASVEAAPTAILDSLPNRTRFLELVRSEVRVAQEADTPLALLTAEFEGYQRLKTEFGEAVADLTLDSIAQFLDNAIQEHDHLGRLKANQFAVLMPQHAAQDAQNVATRINTALANCSVPLGNGELRLTTLMAVAELTAQDTAVSLMQRLETSSNASLTGANAPAMA